MKKIILTPALAIGLTIAVTAQVESPTFVTHTASGTTTAVTYFATSPTLQIRVVGAMATSDLLTANLSIKTGITPVSCAYTNPAGTSFGVAATNGFAIADYVIVETKTGALTNAQITAFTKATNVIFADKIMATVPGDQMYKLGTATLLPVAATTANYQGGALFVGNRGRPVSVSVNATSACVLNSITARYE